MFRNHLGSAYCFEKRGALYVTRN